MSKELLVAIRTSNPVGFLARSGGLQLNAQTLALENYNPSNYVLGKYVIEGARVGSTPLVKATFPGGPGSKESPVTYDILPVEAVNGTHQEGDPEAGGIFQIIWNGAEIIDDEPDDDDATWPVTVSAFKDTFDRDFPFGAGKDTVRDRDITRALNEAAPLFKSTCWKDDNQKAIAYQYLAAHVLALNVQAAGGLSLGAGRGIQSQGGGLVMSKSVGPASLTYTFSESVMKSRVYAPFLRTHYGQRYLSMLLPRLGSNVVTVDGFSEFDPYPSNPDPS